MDIDNDNSVSGRNNNYMSTFQDTLIANDPYSGRRCGCFKCSTISIILGLIVGIAVITWAGWHAYNHFVRDIVTYSSTDIPILRPTNSVVKTKPSDPGGAKVPNRDKLIYKQLNNMVPTPGKEHLLPLTETPIEPFLAELRTSPSSHLDKKFPLSQLTSVTELLSKPFHLLNALPFSSKVEKSFSELKSPPASEDPRNSQRNNIVSASKNVLVSHTTDSTPIKKEEKLVRWLQLGSFRSIADAEKAWFHLSNRHKELLKNVSHVVVQTNLDSKGIWYRIYAGPYRKLYEAQASCSMFKQHNIGCIVIYK